MNKISDIDPISPPDGAPALSGYEADIVYWFEQQARYLRTRQFEQLDLDNLIEELESMARRDRRELRSRLQVLIMHMLKCKYQPEKTSASWLGTIREQRFEIQGLLEQSPSLQRYVDSYVKATYPEAVQQATLQTALPFSAFPADCPFSTQQIMDSNFFP